MLQGRKARMVEAAAATFAWALRLSALIFMAYAASQCAVDGLQATVTMRNRKMSAHVATRSETISTV
jgi:hypothetical protein